MGGLSANILQGHAQRNRSPFSHGKERRTKKGLSWAPARFFPSDPLRLGSFLCMRFSFAPRFVSFVSFLSVRLNKGLSDCGSELS